MIAFIPMCLNVIPRILVISLLCAFHTLYGIIPILVNFIVTLMASFMKWRNQLPSDMIFLGASKDDEMKKKQNSLNLQVLKMKLFEAFLESGPQSIVQIMIIMKNGVSDNFQLLTLFTSILSFGKNATRIYLDYPTIEVTNQIFVFFESCKF